MSVAEKAKHKEPNLVSHDMGIACALSRTKRICEAERVDHKASSVSMMLKLKKRKYVRCDSHARGATSHGNPPSEQRGRWEGTRSKRVRLSRRRHDASVDRHDRSH